MQSPVLQMPANVVAVMPKRDLIQWEEELGRTSIPAASVVFPQGKSDLSFRRWTTLSK